MAGITISGGVEILGGLVFGEGGGPGPGPGPGPTPLLAGSLFSWNSPVGGGRNDAITRSSPTQVGSDSTWLEISAGYHTVAVKDDGTLWAWGNNSSGQVGDGTTVTKSSPVQIGSDTDWAWAGQNGVSAQGYSFAIKTDGSLWAWGTNVDGTTLGIGTSGNKSSPVHVGTDSWTMVASGDLWAVGVQANGTLWGWGSPVNGSIPLDGAGGGYIGVPTQIGNDTNWSVVAGAPMWTGIALKTNGTLWTWGYNNWGQLGDNTGVTKSSPVQLGSATDWASIGCSVQSGFAVKTDGTLWSWGRASSGQLGQNTSTINKSSPVQVGSDTDWARVSSGDGGGKLAVKTDGTLWGWGSSPIGDNTTVAKSSPVQLGSGTNWQDIATGYNTRIAISA
jgi:alpha-tubulin suppressor-like RCC1 family protein